MAWAEIPNAIRFLVEAPPIPLEALGLYIHSKHKHESFEMLCAWAVGTGYNWPLSDEPQKPEKYPKRPAFPQHSEWMQEPKTAHELAMERIDANKNQNTTKDFLRELAASAK